MCYKSSPGHHSFNNFPTRSARTVSPAFVNASRVIVSPPKKIIHFYSRTFIPVVERTDSKKKLAIMARRLSTIINILKYFASFLRASIFHLLAGNIRLTLAVKNPSRAPIPRYISGRWAGAHVVLLCIIPPVILCTTSLAREGCTAGGLVLRENQTARVKLHVVRIKSVHE